MEVFQGGTGGFVTLDARDGQMGMPGSAIPAVNQREMKSPGAGPGIV
jgi:hypothetical protein